MIAVFVMLAAWTAPEARALECCPPGGGRCLSVLTRGDADERDPAAACAALGMTGDGLFDPLRGKPRGCGPVRNPEEAGLLGIASGDYSSRGWWYKKAPPAYDRASPETYDWKELAVSSPGCAKYSSDTCKDGKYEAVDVFVSLDEEFDFTVKQFQANHPAKGKAMGKNLRGIIAHTQADLRKQVHDLTAECKVIKNVIITGHGVPGTVSYNGKKSVNPTTLVWSDLSPCSLAPDARVQFTSCLQACGKAAPLIRQGLEKIFSDPRYKPADPSADPFRDTRFLFNSDMGTLVRDIWVLGPWTYSDNDLGIEYAVHAGKVTQDVTAPACPKKIPAKWIPFMTDDTPLTWEDDAGIANPIHEE